MNQLNPEPYRAESHSLWRALLLSLGVLALLLSVAFWPRARWQPQARPALKAPIVLDELVHHAPMSTDPSAIPGVAAEVR